jgi:hypothetical protein
MNFIYKGFSLFENDSVYLVMFLMMAVSFIFTQQQLKHFPNPEQPNKKLL